MYLDEFKNKTVIVTGATSGIGKSTALKMGELGANVVVSGRRQAQGDAIVDQINSSVGSAIFIAADMADEESIERLVSGTIAEFGQLDFAFNNAGFGGELAEFTEQTNENWNNVLNVNLTGVWLCMKYQIKQMLSQPGELNHYSIVNNSSLWGVGASEFPVSPYVVSKHGVIGLTKAAAMEYSARGIRVNAVCPAWVATEGNAPALSDPDFSHQMQQHHPIKRFGTPEEIAGSVVYLLSSASGFVTGHSLMADGGISAKM